MSIEKLTVDNTITYIIVLLGCLCPGFLILYLYFPEIISKELGSTLILVFATSLTLPILLVNSLFCAVLPGSIELGTIEAKLNEVEDNNKLELQIQLANAKNSKLYESLLGGGIITCITVYFSLVICWLFSLTFPVFVTVQFISLVFFGFVVRLAHSTSTDEQKENIAEK